MALQNRVDPFAEIHAVAARGLFTGNRGIIHDPETRSLVKRRWSSKAWLICVCAFGERRRDVMGRNGPGARAGWTELFFLDEVTALAAGHRPCFFCRRSDAKSFAAAFAKGQGRPALSAPQMDARLHSQRRASGGPAEPLEPDMLSSLPNGTMVERSGHPFALRNGTLLPWGFSGYGAPQSLPAGEGSFTLITPPATVAALRHGYRPVWHTSAGT